MLAGSVPVMLLPVKLAPLPTTRAFSRSVVQTQEFLVRGQCHRDALHGCFGGVARDSSPSVVARIARQPVGLDRPSRTLCCRVKVDQRLTLRSRHRSACRRNQRAQDDSDHHKHAPWSDCTAWKSSQGHQVTRESMGTRNAESRRDNEASAWLQRFQYQMAAQSAHL